MVARRGLGHGPRDPDPHAAPRRFPGQRRGGAEQAHFLAGLRLDPFEDQLPRQPLPRGRQVDRVDRAVVAATREADLPFLVRRDRPRAVDRLAVDREPAAQLPQARNRVRMEPAPAVGPRVQEQIPPLGDHVDEHMDELPRRLVRVLGVPGPRPGHGHAGLPRELPRLVRHLLLRRAVVLVRSADPAVDDQKPRLEPSRRRRDAVHPDVLVPVPGVDPGPVEPQDVDRAVPGAELLDLRVREVAELLPDLGMRLRPVVDVARGVLPMRRPVPRHVPVGLGEVRADHEVPAPEGVEEVARDIGLRMIVKGAARVGDLVVGLPRVEHAEAVVVFGGEDEIAHPRFGGETGPGVGIELPRVEGAFQADVGVVERLVGGLRRRQPVDILGAEPPGFAPPLLAVRAPVDHEAELPVLPGRESGLHRGVPFPDILHPLVLRAGGGGAEQSEEDREHGGRGSHRSGGDGTGGHGPRGTGEERIADDHGAPPDAGSRFPAPAPHAGRPGGRRRQAPLLRGMKVTATGDRDNDRGPR